MMSSPASSPFQFPAFGAQQQQQMPGLVAGNVPHIHLLSTDRSPLSYQAKWSDIHDDSKNILLAIEEKMMEYRDESRRLDQCQRLYDSAALQKGFELESARISQELGGVGAAVVREQSSLEDMVKSAKLLIRNAEVAVRSFMILRHHFSRPPVPALPAGSTPSTTPLALSVSPAPSVIPQSAPTTGPTADFYSGIPSRPSPFLQQTVTRFEAQLSEYGQRVEELARLLLDGSSGDNGNGNSELSLLRALPTVMTNVHDFFIHVAAEVESLHQQIESMRTAFIADRCRRGDDGNPFLEADRRELAKREVAAKRVHPTLHAPMMPQSLQMPGISQTMPTMATFGSVQSTPFSIQSSGSLFGGQGNSNPFPASSTPFQFTPSVPGPALFGSSAPFSALSMFGASTPAASTSSPSLFGGSTPAGSTPASGLFGAGTTPSSGLFGASTGGMFGGASSGSIFGTPAQTPAFGAGVPGGGTPLFGMGTTGAGNATAKAKPRGPRRK